MLNNLIISALELNVKFIQVQLVIFDGFFVLLKKQKQAQLHEVLYNFPR